jgi:propanol-preferring alcohol dehydrogenase
MRAWHVTAPGPVTGQPLRLSTTDDVPEPGPGELLLKVLACGVCRTDLHVAEGDLPVHRPVVTPGHEVVGEVVAVGETTGAGDGAGAGNGFSVGDRAGAAWLRWTDQQCKFCIRGAENLCPHSRYTGWDADGGYADYMTVPAAYAHRLPEGYSDLELAPLLCAGIIGYHALKRAELPPGGRLGLYGFGGSAHLAAQVALAQGAVVHVLTRGEQAQQLARDLGAASVGGPADMPPEPLDAAILFAPVGDLVLPALAALDRGGTLALAGIYLSDIPPLNYAKHLFQERQLRSTTSNTRADAREFLAFAGQHKLAVTVHRYPLEDAAQALRDLKAGRFDGAAVLAP